jgi:hypothetical protein
MYSAATLFIRALWLTEVGRVEGESAHIHAWTMVMCVLGLGEEDTLLFSRFSQAHSLTLTHTRPLGVLRPEMKGTRRRCRCGREKWCHRKSIFHALQCGQLRDDPSFADGPSTLRGRTRNFHPHSLRSTSDYCVCIYLCVHCPFYRSCNEEKGLRWGWLDTQFRRRYCKCRLFHFGVSTRAFVFIREIQYMQMLGACWVEHFRRGNVQFKNESFSSIWLIGPHQRDIL